MRKCPSCEQELQEEALVCRYCGRQLPVDDGDIATIVMKVQKNWLPYIIGFIMVVFIAILLTNFLGEKY